MANPNPLPLRAADLARLAHLSSLEGGWWHDPVTGHAIRRNRAEMMMLMVSEVAECAEAIIASLGMTRYDPSDPAYTKADPNEVMDDHLPHHPMPQVEIADLMIRIGDFMGGFNIDLAEVCYSWLAVARPRPYAMYPLQQALLEIIILLGKAMEADRKSKASAEAQRIGMVGTVGWYMGGAFVEAVQFATDYLRCDDIWSIAREKIAYNAKRADHQRENRIKDGGKAY